MPWNWWKTLHEPYCTLFQCVSSKYVHECHVVCFMVRVMDLGKNLLVCFSSMIVREFMLSLLQAGSDFVFLIGVHVSVGLIASWWLKFMIVLYL